MKVIYGCGISNENAEHRKVKYIINTKIFDHLSLWFVPFTKCVLLFGDETLNDVENYQILTLVHIHFKESGPCSIDQFLHELGYNLCSPILSVSSVCLQVGLSNILKINWENSNDID